VGFDCLHYVSSYSSLHRVVRMRRKGSLAFTRRYVGV
jgi:hypothetical protein